MNDHPRIISPLRVIDIIGVFFAVVGGFAMAGGRPAVLFVAFVWMIIGFGTASALLATYGSDFLRFCGDAFITLFTTPQPNEKYADIAETGSRYSLGLGIITFVIAIIITMAHIDTGIGEVGRHVADSFIAIFLGAALSELFFPFLAKSYRLQGQPRSSGTRLPVLFGMCALGLMSLFLVLWILASVEEIIPRHSATITSPADR